MGEKISSSLKGSYGAFPLHGTVRYSSVRFTFGGVFHWVQYLVLFLVPPRLGFQAIRTATKTWRVNSTDHWLAGENHHYCHWTCDTRPNIDPLDLNQHRQRRIGRTFLYQPKNYCFVVCWGDVPLVDSRGADEWKSLIYILYALCIFLEYVFCLYFYLCICVLLQLKTIWSNTCTSRQY